MPVSQEQRPNEKDEHALEDRKVKRGDSISSVSSFEDAALASVLAAQKSDTPKSKSAQKRQEQRERLKNAGKGEETAGIVGEIFQQQQNKDSPQPALEDEKQLMEQAQQLGPDGQPAGGQIPGYFYQQQMHPGRPQYFGHPRMQRPYHPGMQHGGQGAPYIPGQGMLQFN